MMAWCVFQNKCSSCAAPPGSCLLATAEEERRVADLSYDGLVVRLNSVQHLLDSLGGLERMVVDRCAASGWAASGWRDLRKGRGGHEELDVGPNQAGTPSEPCDALAAFPPTLLLLRRWDDGRPRSAKAREGAHAYDWIAGMFDGSR